MSAPRQKAAGRINIRIRPADKALINRAAAAQGKTRSEFILEASPRAAAEGLLDFTLLRVDREIYAWFLELLTSRRSRTRPCDNCCSRKLHGKGEQPRRRRTSPPELLANRSESRGRREQRSTSVRLRAPTNCRR